MLPLVLRIKKAEIHIGKEDIICCWKSLLKLCIQRKVFGLFLKECIVL